MQEQKEMIASQPRRYSWETQIALLQQKQDQQERRMDQQDQRMVDLSNKVDERFDKLEAHVLELKDKNPVMDFIKEKWQIVSLLVIILVGQPSFDVLKLVVKVLFPTAGVQ